MLQSILSQRVALAAFTESDEIPHLSSHQLEIKEKVITVEDTCITQSISSEKASVLIIVLYIRALKRNWENCSNDRGIQIMKKEMLESLNCRFSDIEGNVTLLMVTIFLDPCFKDKVFTSSAVRYEAKSLLIKKMNVKLPSQHSSDEPSVSKPPEKCP